MRGQMANFCKIRRTGYLEHTITSAIQIRNQCTIASRPDCFKSKTRYYNLRLSRQPHHPKTKAPAAKTTQLVSCADFSPNSKLP